MLRWLDDRLGLSRPDALTSASIVGGYAMAAVLVGLVVSTGQPVLVAMALGLVAGVALLSALPVVVWTILVGVLLVSGPTMLFFPALAKVNWLFSLMGFFLCGAAILYAAVGRHRFRRAPPTFLLLAVLFFAFGVVSLAYSGGPLFEGVRAIKRYFQFFGVLFVLAVVPFPDWQVRRWWIFLLAVGALQLPFAVYQRLVLVPARAGMERVDAIDIVVGTMEGSMTGGGSSSVMALLLVTLLAYVIAAYREGNISLRWATALFLLFLAPLPIGEVKLLVILVPLALAIVFLDQIRRHPARFATALLFGTLIVAVLVWTYFEFNAAPGQSAADTLEATIAYNFGNVGYYGGAGLNRTSVYTYWSEQQRLADPVSMFFGHGLGSSFGGLNEPNPGHMYQAHPWMAIGLTAASAVLWDLGVVGLVLIVMLHLSGAAAAGRLARSARPGHDRALCRSLQALALMLVVMLFYSDAPISLPSQQVLSALCLGLIAWRWRSTIGPGASAGVRGGR